LLDINKAVFLDRDGVINKNVKDLTSLDQFEMLEGVSTAVELLNKSGYLVIVTTNQPSIAKGFCSFQNIDSIHEEMKHQLASNNAHVDAVYLCPHHPEKGFVGEVPDLKIVCECRKPKPGMMLKAAKDFEINLPKSWTIGDSPIDIEAGRRIGVKTIFITSGGGTGSKEEQKYKHVKPDFVACDLLQAAEIIIKNND
jgi:mannose-1-phosphate guanylyltransferase/phosphomannomutase